MPRASAHAHARRRRAETAAARRKRRLAGLVLLASVALITLLLTAFGSGDSAPVRASAPAPATRLLPAGPPRPEVVALQGSLRLLLPVAQGRLTAIGFHASGNGALALDPVGRQVNRGLVSRVTRRLFGGGGSGARYYLLGGGGGPGTASLDVGAPPGTDVYAPVDGTIVGITPYVLAGKHLGARIDLQPSGNPSVVVSLTHLRLDPSLTVGSTVTATSSKVGTILDFADVERQALARVTQDAGNHVAIEVHPAATLSLP
jgi:murein DD-endopeptidase MepM/ murein hydrolase activator NlpD